MKDVNSCFGCGVGDIFRRVFSITSLRYNSNFSGPFSTWIRVLDAGFSKVNWMWPFTELAMFSKLSGEDVVIKKTSSKTSSKNVVYRITCQLCQATYIGQTERTIRSRIIEHSKTASSHVHLHMTSIHGVSNQLQFKWQILATNRHTGTRLAIEALHIHKQPHLMNGCEGARLLPFLHWRTLWSSFI